ncbi:hypothetical protein GJ697_24215 [Pseudoduganella sp. FT25W]|uniref:Uncharacterized protein n=1 Tax=Duganella alba TaxID=2666081 RepID=A0A6L5QPZ0_9BURK|nr:hypothetical protein [Duganella alba]MRX10931.1 hypothetical protein [Duganella alba]
MLLIAEAALHLVGDVLFYSLGRFTIRALSFGRVRPRTLKEFWEIRAERGLAMQIYFEIVAIHLLGLVALASIAVLGVFLYQ